MSQLKPDSAEESLITRRTLLAMAALTLAFGVVLYIEGRPAWCKFGLGFWSAAWTRCTSQHFLDPYTMSHVLHGVIFFWLLWPLAGKIDLPWRLVIALGLEIGWELLENSPWVIERYRQETAALDYTGDSVLNSVGDVAATVAGFAVASRFSWKVSVALYIVLELVALWMARDNLTLNIVMLLWPIEAIKAWQVQALG